MKPYETEATGIAHIIMQTVDEIHAWIFIAIDENGHPCVFSNCQDIDTLNNTLVKLGTVDKSHITGQMEIIKATKQ